MQLRQEDVAGFLQTHHGVLGSGWKEVQSFEDMEDADEFEDEEVEEYITLDLGNGMDARYLQTEATFQLIGLDTALPHLKIGNMVLQGEVTPLIGSEIFLGLIRNQENPHNPSHPPLYTTSNRITFRPIDLWLNVDAEAHQQAKAPTTQAPAQNSQSRAQEDEGGRSMFLQRPAKNGPNRPTVFPGRQRDIIRAEKRAQRECTTSSPGPNGETVSPAGAMEGTPAPADTDMDIDPALQGLGTADAALSTNQEAIVHLSEQDEQMQEIQSDLFDTPGAGPSTSTTTFDQALPSLDGVPDLQADIFATGPRRGGSRQKIGRPKTRPVFEIHRAEQIPQVNLGLLPDNVRILISPLALTATSEIPSEDITPQSLEFTKTSFRRFIHNQPAAGPGSRGGPARPRASQSGNPRNTAKTPILTVPYLVTGGTPILQQTRPAGAQGEAAGPSSSPSRMGGAGDPPEGLEPEAVKDVEGMEEAASREEAMEQHPDDSGIR